MLAAGWPHLHRDIVDVNKLHRCPHSPVHPQRWPEPTLHLGSESGGVLPLQEVHDKEEQRQEGGCEEKVVQEEPLDACQGDLGRDPALHQEVEEVTQWPCKKKPEARGGGELDTPFILKPQILTPASLESLSTDYRGLCGPSRKHAFNASAPGIHFCL